MRTGLEYKVEEEGRKLALAGKWRLTLSGEILKQRKLWLRVQDGSSYIATINNNNRSDSIYKQIKFKNIIMQ